MPLNVSISDLEALRFFLASQILSEQDPLDLIDFSSSPVHVFFFLIELLLGALDAIRWCALYPHIRDGPSGSMVH